MAEKGPLIGVAGCTNCDAHKVTLRAKFTGDATAELYAECDNCGHYGYIR